MLMFPRHCRTRDLHDHGRRVKLFIHSLHCDSGGCCWAGAVAAGAGRGRRARLGGRWWGRGRRLRLWPGAAAAGWGGAAAACWEPLDRTALRGLDAAVGGGRHAALRHQAAAAAHASHLLGDHTAVLGEAAGGRQAVRQLLWNELFPQMLPPMVES